MHRKQPQITKKSTPRERGAGTPALAVRTDGHCQQNPSLKEGQSQHTQSAARPPSLFSRRVNVSLWSAEEGHGVLGRVEGLLCLRLEEAGSAWLAAQVCCVSYQARGSGVLGPPEAPA